MNKIPLKLMIRFFLTGFAFLLMTGLASPAPDKEIKLIARVDKNKISLEDTIRLSITVNGLTNAPEPQLPPLPGFRVRSSSTSSSTQIINGQRNISVTYIYQLVPLKTGSFIFEPATLQYAGITYQTKPITITVSTPDPSLPTTQSPTYVKTFISNANPYVNEQVIYTFQLYRRVEAKNLDLEMSYEDSEFRKQSMGDAKTYSRTINGVQFRVHELSTALYPIHAGKLEIPPAILELDLIGRSRNSAGRNPLSSFFDDPFFRSRIAGVHKTLRSQPIPLIVLPLPKEGRPKNFSNIVGDLAISSNLGKNELQVGDTTTLTLTVKGPGSVKDLSLSLPEIEKQFKIYPDQPESQLSVRDHTLNGEKVFKFALVPLKEGHQTLPPIGLPYFDPVAKKYLTAETIPITLTILPSHDKEKLNLAESLLSKEPGTKNSVQILGEDILPIHTRLSDFEKSVLSGANTFLFAGGMIGPPFMFLLFTAYVRYKQRLKYDTAFVRNRKAFKLANQKLKRLSASSESNPREFAKQLSEIFREYIGNKLNLQGKAITSLEVEQKLMGHQYPQEQATTTRTLLEKYECLQYAVANESINNALLIDESLSLLNQLEKQE